MIRVELAAAFGLAGLTLFLWLATPGYIGPMFSTPTLYERLLPWIVAAGLAIGLAGVVRFSRMDPEAGERSWRYRDR